MSGWLTRPKSFVACLASVAGLACTLTTGAGMGATAQDPPSYCVPGVLLDVKTVLRIACGPMSIDLPRNWVILPDENEGFLFAAWSDSAKPQHQTAVRFLMNPKQTYSSVDEINLPQLRSRPGFPKTRSTVMLPAGRAARIDGNFRGGFMRTYLFVHGGTMFEFIFQGRSNSNGDRRQADELAASIRFASSDQAAQSSHVAYTLAWKIKDTTGFAHGSLNLAVDWVRFEHGLWRAHVLIDNGTTVSVKIDLVALLRYPNTADKFSFTPKNVSRATHFAPTPPGWSETSASGNIPRGDAWAGVVSAPDLARTGSIVRFCVSYQRLPAGRVPQHRLWVTSLYLRVPLAPMPS